MKSARDWATDLSAAALRAGVESIQGRAGDATIKVDGVLLHSQYRPREEACRIIEGASLDPARPVLVLGLGLGYHVLTLMEMGFRVAVLEPEPGVAKLAIDGPLAQSDVTIAIGSASDFANDSSLQSFLMDNPQVFVHPATARVHEQWIADTSAMLARTALGDKKLGIAVVGPLYGGSLPIARYITDAFKRLGHRTLLVDNSSAWPLYQELSSSVESKKANAQLTALFANVLGEWSYARVAEFSPNICLVMAQAPLGNTWPHRLQTDNIVTAFWFVENWRHMTYWQEIAPHYDYFFHIQPGEFEQRLTEAGCANHAYVQTACDPQVHRPTALSAEDKKLYGCDVSFAGAGYYNRNQFLVGLTDYNLKLWGVEWTALELQRFVCNSGARFGPEEFAKIVAGSAINLNLHSSATHRGVDPRCDAVNPRVFEIAACGGFQLCDPCIGLESLFDFETELPVYRDLAELRKKIDHFLEHPDERKTIADRARERALRDHTYEKRARQMLDAILPRYGDRIVKKGVRAQRTVAEVADRVEPASPLSAYLKSLPADTPFTQQAIGERIPLIGSKLGYAEGIFAYLREMRTSSEQLLAMFDA